MKKTITCSVEPTEAFPVFSVAADGEEDFSAFNEVIEIPLELYERYKAASKEFWEVQRELGKNPSLRDYL